MYYMGVDVGSVSTDITILDEDNNVVEGIYLRTKGRPIGAIINGFNMLKDKYKDEEIKGVGCTGSGRKICSYFIGADAVKNEITAHATAALEIDQSVRTIIEIGGQDSKIIILNDGIVTDFAMNTVCAAGTGSFLDRQAERLGININDFGNLALNSKNPVRIAGRCAVFAESDMIHKQQVGCRQEDIIRGLCEALVRNYLSNVGKGKDIKEKIFFQGGVAANEGIRKAFENNLQCKVHVPKNHDLMGSIGAALIAKDLVNIKGKTNFRGFNICNDKFTSQTTECIGCSNRCEIVKIINNGKLLGVFGDRCGKFTNTIDNVV